jgi:hypothetical protein
MTALRKFPAVLTETSYLFPSFVACMGSGLAKVITGQISFFLDTGSQKTILGENDCLKMGIDIGQLPMSPRPLAGWGGTAEAHVINNMIILIRDETGKNKEIPIENILVASLHDKKKKGGNFRPLPSVLGWDFLLKGYHFHCDPVRKEVYLGEWS